jgi:hypothetical protein
LRLTLNGAENRKTLAGLFIAESFGSSIQHLAFATDDIFAAAARMQDLGFDPLDISPNYYDDLEARLDLAPDLTSRLKSAQILYDRDEAGEFSSSTAAATARAFSSRSWSAGAAIAAMAPRTPHSASPPSGARFLRRMCPAFSPSYSVRPEGARPPSNPAVRRRGPASASPGPRQRSLSLRFSRHEQTVGAGRVNGRSAGQGGQDPLAHRLQMRPHPRRSADSVACLDGRKHGIVFVEAAVVGRR